MCYKIIKIYKCDHYDFFVSRCEDHNHSESCQNDWSGAREQEFDTPCQACQEVSAKLQPKPAANPPIGQKAIKRKPLPKGAVGPTGKKLRDPSIAPRVEVSRIATPPREANIGKQRSIDNANRKSEPEPVMKRVKVEHPQVHVHNSTRITSSYAIPTRTIDPHASKAAGVATQTTPSSSRPSQGAHRPGPPARSSTYQREKACLLLHASHRISYRRDKNCHVTALVACTHHPDLEALQIRDRAWLLARRAQIPHLFPDYITGVLTDREITSKEMMTRIMNAGQALLNATLVIEQGTRRFMRGVEVRDLALRELRVILDEFRRQNPEKVFFEHPESSVDPPRAPEPRTGWMRRFWCRIHKKKSLEDRYGTERSFFEH